MSLKTKMDNPNFHWKDAIDEALPAIGKFAAGYALGGAAGASYMTKDDNLTDTTSKPELEKLKGEMAQFAGQYGLRATTSSMAGMAAIPAGMATGATIGAAVGGPFAPITGPIGAVIGGGVAGLSAAGLASTATDAADLASRQLLPDGTPGKTPYGNPQEIQQEMLASALFGMTNLAYEVDIGLPVKGGAEGLGRALNRLAENPGARVTASKIMNGIGANPGLTEARMMDPMQTMKYDNMVLSDSNAPLGSKERFAGKLDAAENTAFSSSDVEAPGLLEEMNAALKREQGKYAKLQANPNVQSLEMDNAQIAQDPLNYLKEKGIVGANGRPIPKEQGGVYGEGDEPAITYLRSLANKPDTNKMTYQHARQEVRKIDVLLNGKIQNNELRMLLTQTKNKINGNVIKGLGEDLGGQYKAIQSEYGPVRDILEKLGDVTDSVSKKNAFIKSLVDSDKKTVNKPLIAGLQQAGVPFDNMAKLLQMQSAREAAPLFAKNFKATDLLKLRMPLNGNKMAAGLTNLGSGLAEGLSPEAQQVAGSLPYTDKTLKFLRGLPQDQFRQLMTTPELFDSLVKGTAAGAAGQKDEANQLLNKAGIK